MEKEDFGREIAQLLRESKWDDLLSRMYGIGLPADWRKMVKPIFDDFLGRPVESFIIPMIDIPEHQLDWLRKAPQDVQDKLGSAIKLTYEIAHSEKNKESGEFILPIIFHDDRWVLLLVGPES